MDVVRGLLNVADAEIVRLRAEIERLRAENAFLRKVCPEASDLLDNSSGKHGVEAARDWKWADGTDNETPQPPLTPPPPYVYRVEVMWVSVREVLPDGTLGPELIPDPRTKGDMPCDDC